MYVAIVSAEVSSALPEAVTRMYGSRVAEIRCECECEYERICECAEVARTNSDVSDGGAPEDETLSK